MANRRFIDFPIAASVGDNDIVLIWQDGLNKQTTKSTLFAGSPSTLASLTDVDISALTNGQILQYNSTTSKWENVDRTDIDLDQLGDVTIVSPTNGQVLVYNSSTSKWENSSGGFVPYTGAVTTVNLGAQSILAGTFVKAGGTSAQFLKADGSVDSTAYGTGSVTSVGLSMPSAFNVANTPLTSNGTIAVTGAGTTAQYIRGDGSLASFPSLTGYVPYTGATQNVDLGEFGLDTGFVNLDTTPTNTPTTQGTMYWDDSRSTAALIMNGTLQHIGQDTFFYVKNSTGSSIAKGTAVRFDGTDGASGHLLIAPFLANGTYPSNYFMGVTAETIANGSFGQVMHFGELSGINTSGYTAGALLYASTTVAGGFQTTAPVAPNNIVLIAAAINSKNNGEILVRPTYGSNINQDEGVKIVSPTTGQLLQLQSNGLWENKTKAQVLGGTSSQFVKGDGSLDSTTYQSTADKGQPNGYASLDGNGKVPLTQINDALIGNVNYQGLWNAATNNPTLVNPPSSGTKGYYYIVSTAGTFAGISFEVGDWIISNGSAWQKVDNTDAVSSVFGRTGNVIAANGDYNTSQVTENTNLYFTQARVSANTDVAANTAARHNAVTLGTANGLSLNVQQLSLQLASGSQNGALSSTDWTTFNNKENAITAGTTAQYFRGDKTFQTLNTSVVPESGNLYFTNARAIASVLTGYTSGAGTISAADSILSAIQKLNGNIGALVTGVSSVNGQTGAVTLTTSNIAEGTNLYFTQARVSANTDVAANTAARHNAVTLGTANGLSLNTQQLSLGLASAGVTGALSGTDWSTFNSKQQALNGTGFVKISGTTISYDNSTYLTTSTAALTYITIATPTTITGVKTFDTGSLILAAAGTANSTHLRNSAGDTTSVLNSNVFGFNSSNKIYVTTQNNGGFILGFNNSPSIREYTLPNASGTIALVGGTGVGTVTSVAALTLGTSGTDLSSTVANSTTTPVITLNVPTASATNRGALSAADWTTFNNKQNALTNPVTGTGTTNYLPKFTGTSTIGNSSLFDGGGFGGFNSTGINARTFVINAASGRPLALELFEFANVHSVFVRPNNSGFNLISSNYISGGVYLPLSLSGRENNSDLVLQTSGNVSIGTTSDAGFKLDVNGTGRFSGQLTLTTLITSGSATFGSDVFTYQNGGIFFSGGGLYNAGIFARNFGNNLVLQSGGVPTLTLESTGAATFSSSVTAGAFIASNGGDFAWGNGSTYIDGDSSNQFIRAVVNNTERLRINSGGNVLIGTTTDIGQRLQVSGGYITQIDGGVRTFLGYDGSGSLVGTTTNQYFRFITNDTERMRILANGNVGIGTASPNYLLHIAAGAANPQLQFTSTGTGSTTSDGFHIGVNNSTLNAFLLQKENAALQFLTNDTERMRITSGGRVLIGTPPPTESTFQLDVNGTGRFSQTTAIPLTVVRTSANSNVGIRYQNNTTSWYSGLASDDSFSLSFNDANLAAGQFKLTTSGAATFSSSVTASSIIRSGGTSSQYLMADGSVSTLTNPVTGTGTAGQVAYWSSGSAITGESNLFWDATNDRLGIGRNNPSQRLDILGSGTVYANIENSGANIAAVITKNTSKTFTTGLVTDYWAVIDSTSGSNTRLMIESGGNVLINTTTNVTGANLNVNGNIRTAAPTGGSAENWKLGNAVNGTVNANRLIRVEIAGIGYDLVARQII
jgi:hypothetical protein